MAKSENDQLIDLYVTEFENLKKEQIQRIGFRDNLIYANLIAITGVISVVVVDINRIPVLLVLPMVCITLGWTYLVNDDKISSMGRYIYTVLSAKIQKIMKSDELPLSGWELANQADKKRAGRKKIQLLIDELVFVLPGLIAILLFWLLAPKGSMLLWVAAGEAVFLLILGIQIASYAEIKKGK